MKYIGIIPARYQSSRFPGKPLCDILGRPMIEWVYQSVLKWDKWDSVWVATDNIFIEEKCKELEIPVIMTGACHQDCLDRASEVVKMLELKSIGGDRYIIIQGDEPLFNVDTLNTDLTPSVVNFYTEVHDHYDKYDSNAVKVVLSKNKKALYFSRYSIPYHEERTKRSNDTETIFKQIGVYSFSSEMLHLYNTLKPTSLENMEGIGLNRLLENDIDIYMRYTPYDSISVDTPEDRDRIVSIIKNVYLSEGKIIDDNGKIINIEKYKEP